MRNREKDSAKLLRPSRLCSSPICDFPKNFTPAALLIPLQSLVTFRDFIVPIYAPRPWHKLVACQMICISLARPLRVDAKLLDDLELAVNYIKFVL
jgi:hypothetical protein